MAREYTKRLFEASKNGNLEEVKQAIVNGADVNAKDEVWQIRMKKHLSCVQH